MKTYRLIIAFTVLFMGLQLNAQNKDPEPVAGKNLTKEYITQNLVYPEADLQADNSGKVVIGMHIDKEGNATNYMVKSTFSEAASPAALAMVKTILWTPGHALWHQRRERLPIHR